MVNKLALSVGVISSGEDQLQVLNVENYCSTEAYYVVIDGSVMYIYTPSV